MVYIIMNLQKNQPILSFSGIKKTELVKLLIIKLQ